MFQATPGQLPESPLPYSNAQFLDDFYIAAFMGWDFETCEVLDPEREAMAYRDNTAYGHITTFTAFK